MSEERAKILEALRAGEITTEEAQKRLLALDGGAKPTPSREELKARMHKLGVARTQPMPRDLAQETREADDGLGAAIRKQRLAFPARGRLLVRNVAGNTLIQGWDRPEIVFGQEPEGLWKANEREGMIMAKVLSGNLRASVPRATNLVLNSVSGGLLVRDIAARIEARSVTGAVELRGVSGTLELGSTSGGIKLRDADGLCHITTTSGRMDIGFRSGFNGLIESRTGTVRLWVPADANLLLQLEVVEQGEIRVELPFPSEILEDLPRGKKLGFGTRANRLWVRVRNSSILVRGRDAAAAVQAVPETQP